MVQADGWAFPHKWLDFKELFSRLLNPANQILSIKYFTAQVTGKFDPDQPIRQKTYIRALQKHIPELSVIYGHFLSNKVFAPLATPQGGQRFVEIIKTEEKGSDVNLAVHFLNDAWRDRFDCGVIVSNDSDLSEAMRLVREQTDKVIGLIMPGKGHPSKELMRHAHFTKRIRKGLLAGSQLPNPIPGTTISKPSAW
ncbi:MAG: NYN domain-containing protein [Desulfobacterales bacterium]|nr:NYN domain-containing protein [Desulfobacterales bacterium]